MWNAEYFLLHYYRLVPPVELRPLAVVGKNNATARLHTGAGDYFVRQYTSVCYQDAGSVAYENQLLAWLDGVGLSFALPLPIPNREGMLVSAGPQGGVALVPWLSGARLDAERREHAELLGAAVGKLQAALQRYPLTPRPGRALFKAPFAFPAAFGAPGLDVSRLSFPDAPAWPRLAAFWQEEVAAVQAWVAGPYRALPQQVCHNDVTPENVLVEEGRIAAVLDFEFATVSARALDLVQGLRLTMRILDGPDPFTAARHFLRGYRRWMPLSSEEAEALPWLMRLRAAITVLFWLGRAQVDGDTRVVPARIQFLETTARWVDAHGDRLSELAMDPTP